MSKTRLAILVYSLAPGGAERVVSLLAGQLSTRFEITIVLMSDRIFYDLPESIGLHYLERSRGDEAAWLKLLKLPLLAWRYRQLLRQEGIEISLSFMTRPNYINILASRMGGGAACIVSERATPSRQYGGRGAAAWINRWLIRRLYPKAETIVANSLGNRRDLIENFSIPPSRVVTRYNPVDRERILRLAEEEAAELPDGFVFVTMGRMDEGKNHRLLIEALASMKSKDTWLLLIGDGPLRSDLEALARNLGVQKRVEFVGARRNPFALMARADCFVFSSRYEGFPNVLLEALACHLPVVSTDCLSGPREILDREADYDRTIEEVYRARYGLLVSVDDTAAMCEAMETMYNDASLREEYAKWAEEAIRPFALESIASQYAALLQSYVKGTDR